MTTEQLAAAVGLTPELASVWAPCIDETAAKWQINTPQRLACFLAQCAHESGSFRLLEENLNYSAAALVTLFGKHFTRDEAMSFARQPVKIANRIYAGRMGNGDEASGDGWKYRGRGLIQITGWDAYQRFSQAVNIDFGANPELLTDEHNAALSAGWFWDTEGLNALADDDDFDGITFRINGGWNGKEDRRSRWEKAKAALVGASA